MWLTGRLVPDHKTIADFRKDNGTAIRKVCARFIALCRMIGLLTNPSVAIDGSKFKAVNNRDKNFTRAKMERRMAQIEESVARYLEQLDTADRQEPSEALTTKTNRLKEKIETLKEQMRRLELLKVEMLAAPDQQISLTDPDARSMATSGRGSGVVGYNVQIAVEANHHLIVMHEVTNDGTDRSQLSHVANETKVALGVEKLDAVADRGYFNSEEIRACEEAGITVDIYISPIETISGCGGSVRATLDAYIDNKTRESLEILPTHRRIRPWTIEIWSSSYSFIVSKEEFATYATRIAEDLMREFVNDWSTAQDLEDLFGEAPKQ